MSVSEPGKIITPWAESGLKNTIPPTANPATGRAGFDQGFSAINMTAKEAGGIPPFGQDFNGIFYEVTNILRYMQAGGQPTFDASLATAIGGYPKGAMVLGSDGVTLWQSKVDSNSTDPNVDPASWGTFDIGLKADLAAPGGAGLIGFLQAGTGAVLRSSQSKMRDFVHVADFGAVGDGSALDTFAIQLAIDYVYTVLGGGAVLLGPKPYKVAQSALGEIYDNDGVPVSANECCIVLRKGVSLIGVAGKTKIFADNPALHIIALVANDGNTIRGFEAYNTWVAGGPGAGHGILQFGTQGGVDRSCKNTVFEDLYVHNVASYGIGISNGAPENVHFNRIRVKDNGADGLDLKSRGDQSIIPAGNSATNIRVINHGGRVTGSAGIDVRGVWHLKNIVVTNYGGNAALDYAGIRFRTKPPITDPYQIVAERSTLNGFTIAATQGAQMLSSTGVVVGSDDVHISNGTVRYVGEGVVIAGNANGNANRCSVSGITTTGCTIYGFRSAVSSDITQFTNCTDDGSPVGFRVEGTNTSLSNCYGSLSVSSGAVPTFLQSSSMLGGTGISLERVSASAAAVLAKGTATDIALRLVPKGASQIAAHANIYPDVANTKTLGSASLPWAGGFTQTAFTVTSDADYKTDPLAIDEVLLDVADEVGLFKYQYLDRVEEKGSDGARWHLGGIVQHFIEALDRRGVDWSQFAFLCHDEWAGSPAVYDDDGNVVSPAVEAGGKYGIRYEEYLVLKSEALARRDRRQQVEIDDLKGAIQQLSARLGEIDGK